MTKYVFRRLSSVKKYLLLIILDILSILLSVFTVLLSGELLDGLVSNPTYRLLVTVSILLMILVISRLLLSYISSVLSIKLSSDTFNEMYIEVTSAILSDQNNEKTQETAELVQSISNDINSTLDFYINNIPSVIVAVTSLFSSAIILFRIDVIYFVFALIIGIIYLLVYKRFDKRVYINKKEEMTKQEHYFKNMFTVVDKIKKTKILGLKKLHYSNLNDSYAKSKNQTLKTNRLFFKVSTVDAIITLITQVFVYSFGGISIIQGTLSLGKFSIINQFINSVKNNLRDLNELSLSYKKTKVSYDRLMEKNFINIETAEENSVLLEKLSTIEINNLNFNFKEKKVLSDINIIFNKGLYIIKGTNGTGKTTLVDLIAGYYSLKPGSIKLNDVDLSNVALTDYRKNIVSYTLQQDNIIPGTLWENLIYGSIYPSHEQIKRLLIEFRLDNIFNYNLAMETKFSENLRINSDGELQKLALIRNLTSNKDLHIFDEPSTYLDNQSKELFSKELKRIAENSIVLVISHENCFDNIGTIIQLDNENNLEIES